MAEIKFKMTKTTVYFYIFYQLISFAIRGHFFFSNINIYLWALGQRISYRFLKDGGATEMSRETYKYAITRKHIKKKKKKPGTVKDLKFDDSDIIKQRGNGM